MHLNIVFVRVRFPPAKKLDVVIGYVYLPCPGGRSSAERVPTSRVVGEVDARKARCMGGPLATCLVANKGRERMGRGVLSST